jgi:hypothetical protein
MTINGNSLFVIFIIKQMGGLNEDNILGILLFILFVYLVLPTIIYYPFRKKWDNFYPKYMAWAGEKKYKTFTSEDIIINGKDIYCEIPLFSNTMCNYEATKDFSKYLTLFKIKEYGFEYRKKKDL